MACGPLDPARLREGPLDLYIATAAGLLLGSLHNDPAERQIMTTARMLGVTVTMRDWAILAYGAAGFLGRVEGGRCHNFTCKPRERTVREGGESHQRAKSPNSRSL